MTKETIHGAVDGPARPVMAPYMVRPDQLWRRTWSDRTSYGAVHGPRGDNIWRRWSDRTIYGAVDGPAGPSTAPYMVRLTNLRRRTWSGGPSTAPYMVRPDHVWRHGWSPGPCTAPWYGPAGPTVGGTIYSMTGPPPAC